MKRILILFTCLCLPLLARAESYADISLPELKAAISAKTVTLVDANGSESYKEGHIPTAIDFESQASSLAKLLPADKNALVVAYCGGETCNAYKQAAKAAKALGYTNVKHFSKGLHGWKVAGEPLEKASGT